MFLPAIFLPLPFFACLIIGTLKILKHKNIHHQIDKLKETFFSQKGGQRWKI